MIPFTPAYKVVQVYQGKMFSVNIAPSIIEQQLAVDNSLVVEYAFNHLCEPPKHSHYRALFVCPDYASALSALAFYKRNSCGHEGFRILYGMAANLTIRKYDDKDMRMNNGNSHLYVPAEFKTALCDSFLPLNEIF